MCNGMVTFQHEMHLAAKLPQQQLGKKKKVTILIRHVSLLIQTWPHQVDVNLK